MSYSTYLVHFNANHDKLGRFDTGDGDHDGIVDDHKNQYKISKSSSSDTISKSSDYVVSSINRKRSKKVDKFVTSKDEKYKVYRDTIDDVSNKISKEYARSKDIEKIAEIVDQSLGDIPYDLFISERAYTDGNKETYVDINLITYGKKWIYETVGGGENNKLSVGGQDISSFRGYRT